MLPARKFELASNLEALNDALEGEAVVGATRHGRRSEHILDSGNEFDRSLHEAVVEFDIETGMVALCHVRLENTVDDRLQAVVVRRRKTEDGKVALKRRVTSRFIAFKLKCMVAEFEAVFTMSLLCMPRERTVA